MLLVSQSGIRPRLAKAREESCVVGQQYTGIRSRLAKEREESCVVGQQYTGIRPRLAKAREESGVHGQQYTGSLLLDSRGQRFYIITSHHLNHTTLPPPHHTHTHTHTHSTVEQQIHAR